MGYWSQMVLVLGNGLEVPPEVEDALVDIFSAPSAEYQGDRLFATDGVKWYTNGDYPEITLVNDFINHSDTDGDKVWFYRIGEDSGDTEQAGSYTDNPFNTEIVHRIEWTIPGE